MKLKQRPEDFRVQELTDVVPSAGQFAFYRLEKRGWATPDALAAIRRRWNVDARRLSYGGLKDRHAVTLQHFSILHGPRRDLQHHDVTVTYLGQTAEPFRSVDIKANHFEITLRAVKDVAKCRYRLDEVHRAGLPNYFDDQRFGSASKGDWIARLMVLGQYEEALKLALTTPYEFDKAPQKNEKAAILSLWGDWLPLKSTLSRSHSRSLVDYLVQHPTDFRGAVARLRPDLQGLYLSAYQSFLWNRMLARCITNLVPVDELVALPLKSDALPAPRTVIEKDVIESLPLPSARLKWDATAAWAPLVEAALSDQGLALDKMKLPGLREPYFSKGDRATFIQPERLAAHDEADERHRGQRKLILRFDLPRGSYATILVKRIAQALPWRDR